MTKLLFLKKRLHFSFSALGFIKWELKYLKYLHLAQCLTHGMLCDMLLPSCPILCNPTDCSPPGFSIYGNSPGKNIGVVCHALIQRIFLTQGSNQVSYISCFGRWAPYHWCLLGSPDTWQMHKICLFNKCLNSSRIKYGFPLRLYDFWREKFVEAFWCI